MKTGLLLLSLWLLLAPTLSYATEQGTVKRCQSLKNKIQLYTDKRRQGGSARQMERWRKARQELETQYFQNRCLTHHSTLD